jgi:hypothetical protein
MNAMIDLKLERTGADENERTEWDAKTEVS